MAQHLGAKSGSGVYQAIIALMPPHDTYIEPFAGSGAILARKAAAARSIVLDKDPATVDRLRSEGIEAFCADALEYLAALDVSELGRVVLYADPPYVLSTRTSEKRYRHELTEADHARLAEVLHRLAAAGVAVIVSGYPSALYDALFPGWNTRQFQAMTRGGVRTEKLWFNFEPGAAHWSTFAGKNRTDRQRIKRKAARWAAKWARLPAAEAQAVLAALLEAAAPRAQSEPAAVDSGVDGSDCAGSCGLVGASVDDYAAGGPGGVDGSVYARRPAPRPTQSETSTVDPILRLDDVATEPETALTLREAAGARGLQDPGGPPAVI